MPEPRKILCPYCGHTEAAPADRCSVCGGFFDELSRKITQQEMGPWFIREPAAPFRPGCSYEVLKRQISRGKVGPNTVLRGPTTRQFWAVARHVPGVAHLLGYCYACDRHASPSDTHCGACGARFNIQPDRQKLGLDPYNPKVQEEVAQARAAMEQDQQPAVTEAASAPTAAGPSQPGEAPVTTRPSDDDLTLDPEPEPASTVPPTGGPPPSQAPAETEPSPAPATAAPPPASPLQQDQPSAGPGAAHSGGVGLLVWLLVALNVALALAVGGVLLMREMGSANAASAPPSETAPETGTTRPDPQAESGPSSSRNSAGETAPDPSGSAAGRQTTQKNSERLALRSPRRSETLPKRSERSDASSTGPNASRSAASEDEGASGGSFFGLSTGSAGSSDPHQELDQIRQRWRAAQRDAEAGRLDEALTKMKRLRASLPDEVQSEGINRSIEQLKSRIRKRNRDTGSSRTDE